MNFGVLVSSVELRSALAAEAPTVCRSPVCLNFLDRVLLSFGVASLRRNFWDGDDSGSGSMGRRTAGFAFAVVAGSVLRRDGRGTDPAGGDEPRTLSDLDGLKLGRVFAP